MGDRKMTADEWTAAERKAGAFARGKVTRNYNSHVCPACGRTIREGAWGGSRSNWERHAAACEKRRKENT